MGKVGEYTLNIMKVASWYNDWLFSFVSPHLKGGILEVGSGIGNFTKLLAQKGKVIGIDIDSINIERLEKLRNSRFAVGYGDIEKGIYFFKNKKFDAIVCMNVLEHIKNDKKALKNMFNLLKEGGILILLAPSFNFAFGALDLNLGHFRRYSKNEIRDKLGKIGFIIESQRYLNFFGLFGWYLNARVFKKRVLSEEQLKLFDLVSRPFLIVEKYVNPPVGLSLFTISRKS